MTNRALDWMAPIVAAAGLAGALVVFAAERNSFREAVTGWARHDLAERTELASAALREPLETGDFAAIHAFGEACEADGVRLTVTSVAGGLVFDSLRRDASAPDSIYETRPCGEWRVRLGLRRSRVLAPFTRAGHGFALAALAGGAGVLLVILSTYRQRVRYRELAKVERFRREFVADVSHELKTPLTGILGAADLLGDAGEDAGTRMKLTEMIKTEASRLNAITRDILDLARLEREGERIERSRTDLAEVATKVVARFSAEASKRGVRLSMACADDCFAADVDENLVFRAVSNLVENALRHSGSPDVTVSLSRRAARPPFKRAGIVISVEDHGAGIPEEARGRVFERFYRVARERGSDSGGSGLGLAIVRRIARLHGGEALLEGAKPSGSRFSIVVPV